MNPNQLAFINLLSGDKLQQDLAADTRRQNERRGAFDQALSSLTDAKKNEIRTAMDVKAGDEKHGRESAFSDKGQEHALDTFNATRKGRGLKKEDMKKVGAALKLIADAARSVLDQKTEDG